ncbi:MAG TPA: group II truncated hemoglobin [Phenylobacterium sp.]|uniref:Group II truncated hemoglobin n=1 Tax=Phenylobacterium conjunctum TaxID=1298959 RepID=A0ABW3T6J6_9CAUL|nr:group II truncated hemoglobin [Phenylobacterium sp.]HQP19436.1 group II truncated hemoglobin [Phenylobacterium sp.]
MSEPTPYERIGGRAGVQALTDRFYDLMEHDPAYKALRDLHAPDLRPVSASLADFLMGWLGGPRDWFDARPGMCMMKAHTNVPITADTAEQWRHAMARAFADTGVEPELAAQIDQIFGRMGQALRID